MEMDQLVAAFAAMSGNNNPAAPPPTAHPGQMEELVTAFATSLTMSGNLHDPAALPVSNLPHDFQETQGAAAEDEGEEEACVLRVRFPDGRVHCTSFGAGYPTAALHLYCHSVLFGAGADVQGRPFRVVRLAGGASEEVRAGLSTSMRDLGLHHSTVHVVLM